jgi:hypothetical protein
MTPTKHEVQSQIAPYLPTGTAYNPIFGIFVFSSGGVLPSNLTVLKLADSDVSGVVQLAFDLLTELSKEDDKQKRGQALLYAGLLLERMLFGWCSWESKMRWYLCSYATYLFLVFLVFALDCILSIFALYFYTKSL